MPIGPGRLTDDAAEVRIPGLGDPASSRAGAAGVLARPHPAVAHQLAGAREARELADFGHDRGCRHERDPPLSSAPAWAPRPYTPRPAPSTASRSHTPSAPLRSRPAVSRPARASPQLPDRLWAVRNHADRSDVSRGFGDRNRDGVCVDIQSDKSYLRHDRLLRMWLCGVQSPTRSVIHELRIGAGRSILTSGEGHVHAEGRLSRPLRTTPTGKTL